MAAVLLGYFGTMVTALAAFMFFLANILDSAAVHHARPQPYKMSAAARTMVAERLAANLSKQPEVAQLQIAVSVSAAPHQGSADVAAKKGGTRTAAKQALKAKQLRFARNEKRRERLASRQPNFSYSGAALGYAPESSTRTAAERIFSTIRSRR